MIGLAARAIIKVPVLYVVHTLLRFELASYAAARWTPLLDPIGRSIDDFIARRADGVLALCDDAVGFLTAQARGPIRTVPPGLDPGPPPGKDATAEVCERFGLEAGSYALYTGNLDGYQELDLLAGASRELARDDEANPRVVVATHHRDRAEKHLAGVPNLRCIEIASFDEMRALTFAAQSLVLTRRRRGGFPIKLLNYMEAARPIIAIESIAPGFEHKENAWLMRPDAGPKDLAHALRTIASDPDLASRLGAGARKLLEQRHRWSTLAKETLDFATSVTTTCRPIETT